MSLLSFVAPAEPAGITACVGPNGGGKTLAAVHKAVLPAWRRGRPAVSNLALFPAEAGFAEAIEAVICPGCELHDEPYVKEVPLAVPLQSWRDLDRLGQLVEPELILGDMYAHRRAGESLTGNLGCVVVFDEISALFPSRASAVLPPQVLRRLQQLRKVHCQVVWTAPAWARCDVALREVTKEVTVCRSYLRDPWKRQAHSFSLLRPRGKLARTVRDGRSVRQLAASGGWEPRCLMRWQTYDATAYDDFTRAAARRMGHLRQEFHWRPRHASQFAYRTLEEVNLLDHLEQVGVCMNCGGMRRAQACRCNEPEVAGPRRRPDAPLRSRAERREAQL